MYNFNKIKKTKFLEIAVIIIIGVLFSLVSVSLVFANPTPKGFEADNVLLKLMVKQGELIFKTIKLTNVDSVREDFKVIENSDFLAVSEEKFSLEAGESKSLGIDFETKKQSGVYAGNILVSSGKEELKIPVILEIETKEILFDSSLNILLDYREVYPGGSIAVENKIFNLENIGLKSVDIDYVIKDFDGKIIFSEKENVAVENQILITKLIFIPESTKTGDYVLFVVVSYPNSVGTSSYFFKIIEEKQELWGSKLFDFWIFIIVLFVIIILFVIFISHRDNLFLELEKQHKQELRKEIKKLNEEREKIQKLNTNKRKKKLKEFRENKKKRLKAVKIIYRTRIKIFKKLKKQKKKNEMQKKLEEWKKQGYNVNEFLIKVSGKKTNLKAKVKNLKKQGYKI
jgi:hypothetical protein